MLLCVAVDLGFSFCVLVNFCRWFVIDFAFVGFGLRRAGGLYFGVSVLVSCCFAVGLVRLLCLCGFDFFCCLVFIIALGGLGVRYCSLGLLTACFCTFF